MSINNKISFYQHNIMVRQNSNNILVWNTSKFSFTKCFEPKFTVASHNYKSFNWTKCWSGNAKQQVLENDDKMHLRLYSAIIGFKVRFHSTNIVTNIGAELDVNKNVFAKVQFVWNCRISTRKRFFMREAMFELRSDDYVWTNVQIYKPIIQCSQFS